MCDELGWPASTLPSGVLTKPIGESALGAIGVAVKPVTVTVKRLPRSSARFGVITSSSPVRENAAGWPFTATLATEPPPKSRSNLDSAWVATAVIVTSPVTVWVGSFLGYRRLRS